MKACPYHFVIFSNIATTDVHQTTEELVRGNNCGYVQQLLVCVIYSFLKKSRKIDTYNAANDNC